jgi:hypothetical protein
MCKYLRNYLPTNENTHDPEKALLLNSQYETHEYQEQNSKLDWKGCLPVGVAVIGLGLMILCAYHIASYERNALANAQDNLNLPLDPNAVEIQRYPYSGSPKIDLLDASSSSAVLQFSTQVKTSDNRSKRDSSAEMNKTVNQLRALEHLKRHSLDNQTSSTEPSESGLQSFLNVLGLNPNSYAFPAVVLFDSAIILGVVAWIVTRCCDARRRRQAVIAQRVSSDIVPAAGGEHIPLEQVGSTNAAPSPTTPAAVE